MIPIEREFYSDILSCAVEGGIGYWSECHEYAYEDEYGITMCVGNHEFVVEEPIEPYALVTERDPRYGWERGYRYRITLDTIKAGVEAFTSVHRDFAPKHTSWHTHSEICAAWIDLDAGRIDAHLADIIVQVALFGEVVYG